MRGVPVLLAILGALLLLAGTAADAAAQAARPRDFHQGMRTGVGYTATPPNVLAGVGAWHFFGTGRLGAFADAQLSVPTLRNDDRYCPASTALAECSVTWVQENRPSDQPMRVKNEYLLLNGGAVYALTSEFAVLIGAGAARRTVIHEFFHNEDNPDVRITETGIYFVHDDPERQWLVQGVAGLLLRAGRNIAFRFGYETAPGSLSVGFYFVLP